MKLNKWTLGLAAVGVVSLGSVAQAEEKLSAVQTALSSTTISGYVDTSAQWNFDTGNANNPRYKFGGASKADGFNLNVVQLTISKPLDEADWAAGYKADLWFGPDANTLGTQSTLTDGASDVAIRQAYVALRAPIGNGLDFKVGVFDTIIGYESLEAGNNPNFTRSYGHTLEPQTHTGVLATYRFNDMVSVAAGVANTMRSSINSRAHDDTAFNNGGLLGMGLNYYVHQIMPGKIASKFNSQAQGLVDDFVSDNFENVSANITSISTSIVDEDYSVNGGHKAESYKTYMGSIALTAPEDWGWLHGSTLYGGVVNGFNGGTRSQINAYAGVTLATPITGLKVGASYDYAHTKVEGNIAFRGQTTADLLVDEDTTNPENPIWPWRLKGGQWAHYDDNDDWQPNGNGYGYGGGQFKQDLSAHAVAVYASYQATEKLSLHARGEWITIVADDMKVRNGWFDGAVGAYRGLADEETGLPLSPAEYGSEPTGSSSGGLSGLSYNLGSSSTDLYAVTGTVQYDLWKNVISRVEFRWDHWCGKNKAFGENSQTGAPDDRDAFMLAANIIYKF